MSYNCTELESAYSWKHIYYKCKQCFFSSQKLHSNVPNVKVPCYWSAKNYMQAKNIFTNNMPEDDIYIYIYIYNLHEQFASAVDLQELFALTVYKKKQIALLY